MCADTLISVWLLAVCSLSRDVRYFNSNAQQVSIHPPPYCSLINLTAVNKHNQHASEAFFSLKSSLMGCSSLSLCRLQCDRECNIGALFPLEWNSRHADQNTCVFCSYKSSSTDQLRANCLKNVKLPTFSLDLKVKICSITLDNNIMMHISDEVCVCCGLIM